MKKIVVAAPVYISTEQHKIFTEQTFNSVDEKYPLIVYINKTYEDFKATRDLTAMIGKELSVAASWNKLIKEGLKNHKYVLVINTDIIFHERAIDNLVKFAEANPDYIMWTGAEWPELKTIHDIPDDELKNSDEAPHFSAFMVNQRTIDEIGWFDENIERAYTEDMDYHRRILMLNHKAGKTASARFYHFGSRTIHCDDELRRLNGVTHAKNNAYFQRKHGYNPDGNVARTDEGFAYPFNDKNKSWKE